MAAQAVLDGISDRTGDFTGYDTAVASEFYPEFRRAHLIARIVYTFPRACYNLVRDHPRIMEVYFDVLRGREGYGVFLQALKRRWGMFLSALRPR